MGYLIGDIGGTKTRIALSKNLKQIDKILVFETKEKYEDFLEFIKKFSLLKIKKACFGFAGNFDKKKERLIYTPNLEDYQGRNLKKDLEKILKCKVILENDAALAGLGEAYYGAGKKYKVFAYLTFSSGIGGAKITNLKVDDNIFGFEPGQSLFFLSQEKNKSLIFKVEDLIGGKSLEKIFNRKPKEIKNKKFWENLSQFYAIFLVNVSLLWSPEVIIVGGGIGRRLDFKILNKDFQVFHPVGWKIKILRSKLGDLSGIYGGLVLLK